MLYSNYLDVGRLHCLYCVSKMSVACSLRNFMFNYMQGLKYIHSLGLAHLDIKPGRLLSWTRCSWAVFNTLTGFRVYIVIF